MYTGFHGEVMYINPIEAGIIPKNAKRVIIDVNAGCVVKIHVECYGDERLLKLVPLLGGGRAIVQSDGTSEESSPEQCAKAAYASYWRETRGLLGDGWMSDWSVMEEQEERGWLAIGKLIHDGKSV